MKNVPKKLEKTQIPNILRNYPGPPKLNSEVLPITNQP